MKILGLMQGWYSKYYTISKAGTGQSEQVLCPGVNLLFAGSWGIWGFLEISLAGRHIWRKALSQNIEGKSEKVFGYLKQQQQNILYNSLQLFATPWTVAYQTPLSMEISRQEYWSGLPFQSHLQGIFSTCISCIAQRFFTVWATREALHNSQ